MRKFTWVSGQLSEVQRFINVPMRWCEQYPARERRELWLTTAEAKDLKLVVHTRVMPARAGHWVVGVLEAGRLVGLHNLNTGEVVNFVRSDPPLLWRRCDGTSLVVVVVAAASAVYVGLDFVGALAGGLLGLCSLPCCSSGVGSRDMCVACGRSSRRIGDGPSYSSATARAGQVIGGGEAVCQAWEEANERCACFGVQDFGFE